MHSAWHTILKQYRESPWKPTSGSYHLWIEICTVLESQLHQNLKNIKCRWFISFADLFWCCDTICRLPYFETSAATGYNVTKAVDCLLNRVMLRIESAVDKANILGLRRSKDQPVSSGDDDGSKCSCWPARYLHTSVGCQSENRSTSQNDHPNNDHYII